MLTGSNRHWATLLAVGLPLLAAGCASGGMATHGGPASPGAPEANASHMDALALADRLKAEGNFSSAVSMYQQANQAHPNDVRPWLGLGECLLAMGSNADAAQAYSGALGIDPNNIEALRGLGHARILLGQPQFAVAQYQTALKVAPNDTRILNGLGVAQDMMGDHAAAQKNYHQILTLDPANQSAKNNLALSLALAGDNAGGIKILEDVSKSSSATAVNRQNLALLYGASGQMAQAEQVSRADLPQDAVNRNMAAWSANGDAAQKQQLLKESLGVELKGRQYTPAARPITPLTNLAQASSLEDQPLYMSAQEGDTMPVITTDKAGKTQTAQATEVVVKPPKTKDGWSEWDEQLVDATDVNGATNTQTAAAPATAEAAPPSTANTAQSQQSSQDNGSPRFLSSSNAIADDKPATSAATAASTPSTPSAPTKPAATSSATATQMAAVPPPTSATAGKPTASASATPTATTTSAEKPAAPTPPTSAAASTAATAGAATTASTTASTASGANSAASSMTVTAKAIDVAKIYTVQIASYRSEQEASAGWQTLTTEQADLLAKLPHAVAKADLGAEKGVFYRLQVGSFSDRNAAKALCSDLKNHSIDCMVVEASPAAAAPTSTQQSMLAPDDSFVIGAR
jgi:Flp pilus assembly protein TadD